MITPSLYADYSKMQEEILNIYSFFEKSAKTLNIKRKQTRKASGMMNIFCINKQNIPHICIFMQRTGTHGFGTWLAPWGEPRGFVQTNGSRKAPFP